MNTPHIHRDLEKEIASMKVGASVVQLCKSLTHF